MKKLTQTRLHKPGETKGNCWPTVVACIMDLDSPEDAFQVQELYDSGYWHEPFMNWIDEQGYDYKDIDGHLYDDSLYFVTGTSPRFVDIKHIVIYKNGKLYHDPHPDGTGILTEDYFEQMLKK